MLSTIQVHILSRETIKPSTPTPDDKKCTKLCLMDQFMPPFDVSVLLFYPTIDGHEHLPRLKESLSKTLIIFYPLSGRFKDNTYINCNDEGIPFLEAKADCSMLELLTEPDVNLLQHFIPCKRIPDKPMTEIPLLAVQVTTFTCGGLVIATSANHKFIDGISLGCLIKNWAANLRGYHDGVLYPDFESASKFFPPSKNISAPSLNAIYGPEAMCKPKRYVLDATTTQALRDKARSTNVPNPTRLEVVSAFMWKHLIDHRTTYTSSILALPNGRASGISHPINIRKHVQEPNGRCPIGNTILQSSAILDLDNQKDQELDMLVRIIHESFPTVHDEYVKKLHDEDAIKMLSKRVEFSLYDRHNIFVCSSWCNLGGEEIDFGWGKPVWVCPWAEPPTLLDRNTFILMDVDNGKGIEVWCIVQEEDMARLEHDHELLEFATPISGVYGLTA